MADPILGLAELIEGDALGYLRQNDRNLIVARLAIDCRIAANNIATPPGTVGRGNAWILSASGSGLWTGHAANTIAVALSDNPSSATGWFFYTPQAGHRVWVMSGSPTGHLVWNGSSWVAV